MNPNQTNPPPRKGESIAAVLLRFSLPLILSGILQQLYNWADAFIVGNVEGDLSLAAIGSTGAVVNIYLLAITGFTLGLSILFAQKYGSGEHESIPGLLSAFAVILGGGVLALAAAGIALTPGLLRLMNTTPETLRLAQGYLRIVLAGTPFLAVYNVYAAALRGVGDSRTPFWSVVFSSLVNVGLDLLFVVGMRWSVWGAALATVLSQVAMTVFLIAYTAKKHPTLRFVRKSERRMGALLRAGFSFGVPPMLQSCVNAFGNLLLQSFMNGFGTQTVTAITTAYRVDTILLLPIINLASGISTMVAQSHGARQPRQAQKTFGVGMLLMLVVSLLMTGLILAAGEGVIAVFGVSAEAVQIGGRFFGQIATFYVVYGVAMAMRGYLEGTGDVLYSSAVGVAALLSRLAASYTAVSFCGSAVIAYAEAFSWGVMLLMYLPRLIWRVRTLRDKADGPQRAS